MYVYKRTEFSPFCLFTVGYYDPNGQWVPESDHEDSEAAAKRVAFLNGGQPEPLILDIVAVMKIISESFGENIEADYWIEDGGAYGKLSGEPEFMKDVQEKICKLFNK